MKSKGRTKTYQSVEDVAAAAAEFHRKMKELCMDLAENTDDEKTRTFLTYLQETEKRFEKGLESFRFAGDENTEETWYQYLPKVKDMIPEEPSRHLTFDEAGELALDFHSRLVTFYKNMAGMAGAPPGTREIFTQLAEQQEQEKKTITKTLHQVRQLP